MLQLKIVIICKVKVSRWTYRRLKALVVCFDQVVLHSALFIICLKASAVLSNVALHVIVQDELLDEAWPAA